MTGLARGANGGRPGRVTDRRLILVAAAVTVGFLVGGLVAVGYGLAVWEETR